MKGSRVWILFIQNLVLYFCASVAIVLAICSLPIRPRTSAAADSALFAGKAYSASVIAAVFFLTATISFFPAYFALKARYSERELTARVIRQYQLGYVKTVSDFGKRNLIWIFGVALGVMFLLAVVDSFFH